MKIKKLLIFIIFPLWGLGGFAQPYQWQWAKAGGGENKLGADLNLGNEIYSGINYHEEVTDLKNTSDNHTYLLSHIAYNNTNFAGTYFNTYHQPSSLNYLSNVFLGKVDCEGSLLWHKVFGGGGGDHSHSMGIDNTDNVYVSFTIQNRGHHDSLANTVGSNFLLPVHFDTDTIMDPIPRALNGTIIQNVTSTAYKSIALIKYNSAGEFQWLRMPQSDSLTYSTITNALDYGVFVEPNGTTHWMVGLGNGNHLDGQIQIAGLLPSQYKYYVLKYDTNGNNMNCVKKQVF